MFVLRYWATNYDGGEFKILKCSKDRKILEEERTRLLKQSQDYLNQLEQWKEERERILRPFFERNKHALVKNQYNNNQQEEDNKIRWLINNHHSFIYFEWYKDYFDITKVNEPLPVIEERPTCDVFYEDRNGNEGLVIEEVEELI